MSLPAAPAPTSSVAAVADTSCVGPTMATVAKENYIDAYTIFPNIIRVIG